MTTKLHRKTVSLLTIPVQSAPLTRQHREIQRIKVGLLMIRRPLRLTLLGVILLQGLWAVLFINQAIDDRVLEMQIHGCHVANNADACRQLQQRSNRDD